MGVILWSSGRFAFRAFEQETRAYQFWKNREQILAHITAANQAPPKILVFDDGIISFSLEIPTIHGFQFAGDFESFREKSKGNLLHHAYAKGFDIITSLDYLSMEPKVTSSEELRIFLENSFLEKTVKQELGSFNYSLLYYNEITQTPFIKFEPKQIIY
jgi:hypothetical protein